MSALTNKKNAYFGICTNKYGINWMFNCPIRKEKERRIEEEEKLKEKEGEEGKKREEKKDFKLLTFNNPVATAEYSGDNGINF